MFTYEENFIPIDLSLSFNEKERDNLPSNKKEGILFGLMMVFGMVLFMYTYNLMIEGLWRELSVAAIILQFLVTVIVAFVVESFLIGPVAGGFVSKLPYDKTKKWKNILAMSTCMVIGMVLSMSAFGLISKFMIIGIRRLISE